MVKALGASAIAWAAETTAKVKDKMITFAATVAQDAHTAAVTAGTVATTAFGVAMSVLTSPITLVVAAIAGLVAGIVLLVKNWDTVKSTAASVWDSVTSIWGSAASWINSTVIKPITSGFKGFFNGLIGMVEGFVNFFIRGINGIIRGLNKIQVNVPQGVPLIGGTKFGINIPTVSELRLPRLAAGAVIPPNREFMAVLGDQNSGNNIEAPEGLIRKIVREESGGGNAQTLVLLQAILDAIRDGHIIMVDGSVFGRTAIKSINDANRRAGKQLLLI